MTIIFFGISFGLLTYAFLYTKERNVESVTGYSYMAGIISFVAILGRTPVVLMATVNIALAIGLYAQYYKRFEYTSTENDHAGKGLTIP